MWTNINDKPQWQIFYNVILWCRFFCSYFYVALINFTNQSMFLIVQSMINITNRTNSKCIGPLLLKDDTKFDDCTTTPCPPCAIVGLHDCDDMILSTIVMIQSSAIWIVVKDKESFEDWKGCKIICSVTIKQEIIVVRDKVDTDDNKEKSQYLPEHYTISQSNSCRSGGIINKMEQ